MPTKIVTIETGYKSIETNEGAQTEATAEAEATCFVGTNDSGQTKLLDKFHTHIIAPD